MDVCVTVDLNECELDSNLCSGGVCTNIDGAYICLPAITTVSASQLNSTLGGEEVSVQVQFQPDTSVTVSDTTLVVDEMYSIVLSYGNTDASFVADNLAFTYDLDSGLLLADFLTSPGEVSKRVLYIEMFKFRLLF